MTTVLRRPYCSVVARGIRSGDFRCVVEMPKRSLTCANGVEPVTGIEPACPAWEAGALPLSYTGMLARKPAIGSLTQRLGRNAASLTSLTACSSPTVTSAPKSPQTASSSTLGPGDGPAEQRGRALDKFFRLFDTTSTPSLTPQDQPELTRLVEVDAAEGLVLHPGEFVLGSTLETVTLPDDLAARVEGKSSLGRLGLLTHATAGFVDPPRRPRDARALERRDPPDHAVARHEDRSALLPFACRALPKILMAQRHTAPTIRASAARRRVAVSRTSTVATSERVVLIARPELKGHKADRATGGRPDRPRGARGSLRNAWTMSPVLYGLTRSHPCDRR